MRPRLSCLRTLMTPSLNLQEWFGSIDIYLFDQLLKGRFVPGMRVLDAGCGSGRNLVYFLRSGYEVFGIDESREAIAQARRLAAGLDKTSFRGRSLQFPTGVSA